MTFMLIVKCNVELTVRFRFVRVRQSKNMRNDELIEMIRIKVLNAFQLIKKFKF